MLAGALFGSLLVGVLMLWLNYRAMARPRLYRRYGAGRERASNWMVAALVAMSALLTGLVQVAIGAGRFGL